MLAFALSAGLAKLLGDMEMDEQRQGIQIQVTWEGLEDAPVMAANVVMVLQTSHEFILTFGFASPPVFTTQPSIEEVKAAKVSSKPIVRLAMPPGRIVELLQVLQQQLTAYQQAQKH